MVKIRSRSAAYIGSITSLVALACSVESVDSNTGGVGAEDPTDCPAGIAVVLSDYSATQIALSDLEGETLSASFLSTASTETAGLAFALSGDVAVPSSAPPSKRIVLLDRFGTNVITWADPKTAEVLGQLPVGTGFESNPSDYVEVGAGKAFVSRSGHNEALGQEEHDQGDDLLVIDTDEPAILGRIAMPVVDDVPPRPGGMLRLGDEVIVALDRVTTDWTTEEAMLVGVSIEDEEVTWQYALTGLKSCGRPSLSPDGKLLAVACTGAIDFNGVGEDLNQSVLALFDADARPLQEVNRFRAEDIAGEAIQKRVAFANNDVVLLATQTPYGGDTHNRWLALDLETGNTTELLEAPSDGDGNGRGLVFSSITCAPGCSDLCLLADAAGGVLQRARVQPSGLVELIEAVQVENAVGMPPRDIGLR